ncbi:nuclear transport factor 2 family protein [Sphingobacterium sp. lm-10]|uniref:nuclear transport factor 2 family protein n=1 Tax=Sphingobacterium sp. lm-10 TaxID=2944904 RepID=UPI002022858D|nr:nuclear transport factor 2 family protein [Sphingobacterium sp. lm-10]MCL7986672.1 nuclear transport factor 2 family protein [Sphingobacterium sp. lm-10]
MKNCLIILILLFAYAQISMAQSLPSSDDNAYTQQVIALSKQKWSWMSQKNVDSLASIFHPKSAFVHMSRTLTKDQELDVIKTGDIHYKNADIREISAQSIGNMVILLSKLKLEAIVRGNEANNPFVVTEVYIQEDGKWMLASMSFTKLSIPIE